VVGKTVRILSPKRILCIDYGLCNFHNLLSLVQDGHRVYLVNNYSKNPRKYFESLGIKILQGEIASRESKLLEWLNQSEIDIVIVTNPKIMSMASLERISKRVGKVIGLNEESAKLETHKLFLRNEVEGLGINVPKLLKRPTAPCVVKPVTTYEKVDHAQLCLTQEDVDKLDTFEYFVEEFIPDNVETNVAYAMSGGKWSIMHTQEVIGEDVAKHSGNFVHWTKTSSFAKLSKKNEKLALKNAEIFLDWASQFGGDYVGQLTGLIKDGEWYFCENNVRPEQSNSLPYFISGNEWLESMSGNPDIIGNAFPNDVHKMIVMPDEPDSVYPFHLHIKYGVAIPCGLDILGGEYRVSTMFRNRSDDQRIGIVICDKEIPSEFVKEFANSPEFSVSHCFT
jgi:hypothetical protein